MNTIARSRLDLVRLSHPQMIIEMRDGVECMVIPTYDFARDIAGEHVAQIVDDPPTTKPQVGETRQDVKTGAKFDIVSHPDATPDHLKIRKGRKSKS